MIENESEVNGDYLPKPAWLRASLNAGTSWAGVRKAVSAGKLHTICEEARCPNQHECWGERKTASFMILGDVCTRRCRFCAVKTGKPGEVDKAEPQRLAQAVRELGLSHVVITMVNRDDLDDGGASALAAAVNAVRELSPSTSIEVLSSDLMARPESIAVVAASKPSILSHNIETVRRLTPQVRSRSDYDRSLKFLELAKTLAPASLIKSSMMLGLGEERDEVMQSLADLLANGVQMVNLGQYLQPSRLHAPVVRYWTPEEFADIKREAKAMGFIHVEAAPLVRSSYHAGEQWSVIQGATAS